MKLSDLTEAESELVKNILSYEDSNGNIMKLHVGENKGKYFITLKGAHADFAFNTPMKPTRKGSAFDAKVFKDGVEKTWNAARDTSAKERALALRKTLDNITDQDWDIES